MLPPDYLFGWLGRLNQLFAPRPKPWRVRIVGDRVSIIDPKSREASLDLPELRSVEIVTTDDGPFNDDCWWRLFGADPAAPLAYPNMADGNELVVKRIIDLPGFDHMAMMAAMGSTENARFQVWSSPTPS